MSAKHKHRAMDRPVTRRYLDRQLTRLYTDLTRTIIHASEPESQPQPWKDYVGRAALAHARVERAAHMTEDERLRALQSGDISCDDVRRAERAVNE